MLRGDEEIEVVASCADMPSLLAAVDADPPDVVLTDIRMPPQGDDVLGARGTSCACSARLGGPRLPAEGADRAARRADPGDPRRRRGRLGDRPEDRRGAGPRPGPLGGF